MNQIENLEKRIKRLLELKEDAGELNVWTQIFELLDERARRELLDSLDKEIEELESLKG